MLIAYQVFASAGDWRIAGNKQSSNGPACAGLEQEILQGGPGPKITLGKEKATLLMLVR